MNGVLQKCNVSVTRVVRLDKSGTTQVFKNYLQKVGPNRSGATCAPGNGWTFYAQDANNTVWPEGTGCTPLIRPASSGNAAVVSLCLSTVGSVCYGEIADVDTQGLTYAKVKAGAGPKFISPLTKNPATGKKTKSNCSTTAASLPGSTPSDAVGLNPNDTWATDNNAATTVTSRTRGRSTRSAG